MAILICSSCGKEISHLNWYYTISLEVPCSIALCGEKACAKNAVANLVDMAERIMDSEKRLRKERKARNRILRGGA